MRRAWTICAIMLCAGCVTSANGPCKNIAERYERRHQVYGRPVYTVHYYQQMPDGSVLFDARQGRFIAHAINYWMSADGKRTYVDASFDPPRTVSAPSDKMIFWDSFGERKAK